MAYQKRVLLLILFCSIIRILLAASIEFGNDEVYYYTYALHLQSNYFDHPPGVAVLIKLFTLNLSFDGIVFIRLGAIACAAASTWLCFAIGKLLRNERTGWIAAILYNTSVYTSIIAGNFILPDSPQVICWLAAVYVLLRLILSNNGRGQYVQWLLFGLLAGLCIMCKVHGVFLWVGAGLYILLFNRRMLTHPGLYLAFIISAAVASPILFWNMANNFITWRYHSDRVAVNSMAIRPDNFLQAVIGQLLYNNPVNVALISAGLVQCCRKLLPAGNVGKMLACLGLPIIIVVTGIALWRDVLPHWSGPGFMTLTFFGAAWLDDRLQMPKFVRSSRALLTTSIALIIVVAVGATVAINFYPGTIGKTREEKYGDDDFTLDMYGWQQFGDEFRSWEQGAVKAGELQSGLPIVCNKWFPAAHIDYYVTRNTSTPVIGVGLLTDLHQYAWLNHLRGNLANGQDALCIIPSNYPVNMQEAYGASFNSIVLLKTFTSTRGGKLTRYFRIYLLKGYRHNDEVHTMAFK